MQVLTFDGSPNLDKVEKWLGEVETNFKLLQVPEEVKHEIITSFLVEDAEKWWSTVEPTIAQPMNWEKYKEVFLNYFFPPDVHLQKMEEFESLKQIPGLSVVEFTNKFCTLGRFVPSIMANEQLKMLKFTRGLSSKM